MADILIIDDDKDLSFTLCGMVDHMGHAYTAAHTLKEGLRKASSGEFDVVFLDVRLPDGNGLGVIPHLQQGPEPAEIIIVTAYGDPGGAELALKSGAWDYLIKPLSMDELQLSLGRALQYRRQKRKCAAPFVVNRLGIIGDSSPMKRCIEKLAHAASLEAGTLITGETGTGKELFARAIHANSTRADGKFVTVDCAALPENLVESILFGHSKGAFTGASETQGGLIKEADGGSLFLDEIGELPLIIQRVFLRVLQERRFRPVGMKREISSDFRVIAATNQNLDDMVKQGLFREDLLFRIRALLIVLPPLRERSDDIKDLVVHHTVRICDRYGMGPKGFSPESLDVLTAYQWPGNVRQLVNTLENAITAARNEPMIYAKHLPLELRIQMKSVAIEQALNNSGDQTSHDDGSGALLRMNDFINRAKRQYLNELICQTHGNVSLACDISGLSKSTLYDQLNKYGISRPKRSADGDRRPNKR